MLRKFFLRLSAHFAVRPRLDLEDVKFLEQERIEIYGTLHCIASLSDRKRSSKHGIAWLPIA